MDVLRYELGLSIPADVSVVGFDDVPPAAWPAYDLTTFRQHADQMVGETVGLPMNSMGAEAEPRQIVLPGALAQPRTDHQQTKGLSS